MPFRGRRALSVISHLFCSSFSRGSSLAARVVMTLRFRGRSSAFVCASCFGWHPVVLFIRIAIVVCSPFARLFAPRIDAVGTNIFRLVPMHDTTVKGAFLAVLAPRNHRLAKGIADNGHKCGFVSSVYAIAEGHQLSDGPDDWAPLGNPWIVTRYLFLDLDRNIRVCFLYWYRRRNTIAQFQNQGLLYDVSFSPNQGLRWRTTLIRFRWMYCFPNLTHFAIFDLDSSADQENVTRGVELDSRIIARYFCQYILSVTYRGFVQLVEAEDPCSTASYTMGEARIKVQEYGRRMLERRVRYGGRKKAERRGKRDGELLNSMTIFHSCPWLLKS